MSADQASVALNDGQIKFLASMMQNSKSKPDINWDAVAEEFGMSAKSAKERYRLLAIKLGWNKSSDSAPTTPKKPAGVTKRTGKVGDSAKKGKAKGKKSQEPVSGEDDGGEGNELA